MEVNLWMVIIDLMVLYFDTISTTKVMILIFDLPHTQEQQFLEIKKLKGLDTHETTDDCEDD
jgi:hypothetical protein